MNHIEIQNLCMHYTERRRICRSEDPVSVDDHGRVQVLDHIALDVSHGEMVCILGPSGCGKSTLLRIVAGFEKPSAGTVRIDGRTGAQAGSDFVFVFQQNGLFPWMSVAENVGLGLRHLKDENEKRCRVMEFVEMVELEGFEHHYPSQLSGGMQRRVELARALAVNPAMLIMDEPFSGLDFLTHMKMREEVVNLHEFIRKTVLVVTHDIDDALIMGDRVIVLSGRPARVKLDRKLACRRPRDFKQNAELNRLRNDIFLMLGVPYAV